MVSKDDRLSSGGRPSLLSAEQNNPADGRSVLSALDGKPAKAAKPAKPDSGIKPGAPAPGKQVRNAPAKGRNVFLWSAAFAALVTVAGGALLWMASVPDEESLVAEATPPVPSIPAPAAVAAAAVAAPAVAATVEPPDSDVSTAAILRDTSAAKEPPAKAATAVAANPKPANDALTQALERPTPPEKKAETLAQNKADKAKLAHHDAKPEGRKQAPKEKPKAQAKAEPKPDRDATLLAALMAHTQPNSHIPRKSTPAQQLQVCRQYNAAGAEQCRARLCANGAQKEPECKARHKTKVASDS